MVGESLEQHCEIEFEKLRQGLKLLIFERFGVEDDMSFQDLAINLDNQSSKKVVKPNSSKK